jgi:3-phosphoglycerate kinase
VLGGAKVSGKVDLIKALLERVDVLLVGGGMMYTFIRASGLEWDAASLTRNVSRSARSCSPARGPAARDSCFPVDTIVAQEIDDGAPTREVSIADIPEDWIGVDIGPKTVDLFKAQIATGRTIFWNGPMGIFEKPSFAEGTRAIARAIADATGRGAQTIVGGGDSVAAVNLMGIANRFTHISTGGGASLEFMEGRPLPGVEALCDVAEVAG